jgi:hypothetical protein
MITLSRQLKFEIFANFCPSPSRFPTMSEELQPPTDWSKDPDVNQTAAVSDAQAIAKGWDTAKVAGTLSRLFYCANFEGSIGLYTAFDAKRRVSAFYKHFDKTLTLVPALDYLTIPSTFSAVRSTSSLLILLH